MLCFIVWIVWRTAKKNRKGIAGASGAARRGRRHRLYDNIVGRIPFLKGRQRSWQNLDGTSTTDVRSLPPAYETANGYLGSEKPFETQQQAAALAGAPPMTNGLTLMTSFSHQPAASFSSVNAAQFGTVSPSDESSTLRSRMPDAFYNQSQLARQPSDAYDPARRQVHRASELSSLSSGFGDGEMMVPQLPPPAQAGLRQSTNFVGRFPWAGRPGDVEAEGDGTSPTNNRDTIYTDYTETSEDSPPRFRTISSWVNQQTGRVKRAGQRSTEPEEIPPVPDLSMMADDGEVPRRPDTIPANNNIPTS